MNPNERRRTSRALHDLAERLNQPEADPAEVAVEVLSEGFDLWRSAQNPPRTPVVSPRRWAVELVQRLAIEGLV
jgi:hypothetical protein